MDEGFVNLTEYNNIVFKQDVNSEELQQDKTDDVFCYLLFCYIKYI